MTAPLGELVAEGYRALANDGGCSQIAQALRELLAILDPIVHAPPPEPDTAAYRAGVDRLARSLYEHVYGAPMAADDPLLENYVEDALAIAASHPHLLDARERGIA